MSPPTIRFRSLPKAKWLHPQTPPHRRKSGAFRASWSDTLDLVQYELLRVKAKDIIIGAGFREGDIRLDGWPRSNARVPDHPGIELSFTDRDGQRQVYATDTYAYWQHNVRAIALTLEALRAVDRYGASQGKQYAGFRELPAAGETSTTRGQVIIQTLGSVKDALRATHPDTRGPDAPYSDIDHQAVKHAAGIA